jgi:hypothetical protein
MRQEGRPSRVHPDRRKNTYKVSTTRPCDRPVHMKCGPCSRGQDVGRPRRKANAATVLTRTSWLGSVWQVYRWQKNKISYHEMSWPTPCGTPMASCVTQFLPGPRGMPCWLMLLFRQMYLPQPSMADRVQVPAGRSPHLPDAPHR